MATYADNNATSAGYDQLFAWEKSHGVESAARSSTIFDVYKNCFIHQAMLMVLTVVEIRRLFSEL